jgi:hypothetical protein
LHLGVVDKPLMTHPKQQSSYLCWSGVAAKFDAGEHGGLEILCADKVTLFQKPDNSDL